MSWTEKIAPDEAARFESYAAELRALQRGLARDRPHFRALHSKAHVGVAGTLTVGPVPERLRAGVFAEPRTWPVYVRYSNGSPGHAHDGRPDLRGIAVKLVGVPGAKLIPGLESALTQDFLFIPVPATQVKDPDEFMTIVRLGRKGQALLVPRLVRALGFKRAFKIIRAFLAMPKLRSLATARFYTAAPLLVGETPVKLALFPEQADARPTPARGPDALREDLVARLAEGPLRYTLHAQAFVDEATTPIEDASVVWPEALTPQVPLAELLIPAQDVTSARGREIAAAVEAMSFDPWHALPVHRPLGAVMRARAAAYRESVLERGAAAEPTSVMTPED